MNRYNRTFKCYDPAADLALRWPDWKVQFVPMSQLGMNRQTHELFIPWERVVLVDDALTDTGLALAHVVAHIDHHLGRFGDCISNAQCEEANEIARIRLGREDLYTSLTVPMDGDPSVSLEGM